MSNTRNDHLLFGERLIDMGIVTRDQLQIALTEQKRNGEYLGKNMVRLGFASEAVVRDVLGGAMRQESIALQNVVPDQEAKALIPEHLARRLHVLPLHLSATKDSLRVAMVDPFDLAVLDELDRTLGGVPGVLPVLAGETEINEALDRCYGFDLSVDGILHEIETGETVEDLNNREMEHRQPVIRLVEALLADAVKRRTSDIHIEPEQGFLRIRYRIDGVLQQIRSLHKDYWSPLSVRIKVLAGLDITETRAAQDGRFSLSIHGNQVDFRASTLPTLYGENIVLRVLDRRKGIMRLQDMGLDERSENLLEKIMRCPQGLSLITGPTGSGKTTTLYALLHELNQENVNIMTLEDPVEYPTTLIRQSSINTIAHMDFSNGMRALMRQDPDIILVGEIRDRDTANMALRAAMTGHQVFSTLHSISALGAIPRLRDIGVQDSILSGNLTAVIAQRLLRRLCTGCRGVTQVLQADRCPDCAGLGYRGRVALLEGLMISQQIDALIAQHAELPELLSTAMQHGLKTLDQIGLELVQRGISSIEELARVVDLGDKQLNTAKIRT